MYQNQKILILGLARSGYEIAKLLSTRNNEIVLTDCKSEKELDEKKIKELQNLNITLHFGENPEDLLDQSFDLLIKNPGIAIDHPYVKKAKKLNIPVTNELEVSYEILKQEKQAKFIAITGTNGKTTTTTLIYKMLKEAYSNVYLAGNIGYPLASFVNKAKKNDLFVVEVSCQQLENITLFQPDIAIMTNISKAHLEFMKTYEHYKEVKSRITQNQTHNDIFIYNENDPFLKEVAQHTKATLKSFSVHSHNSCAFKKENALYYGKEKIMDCADILLIGDHNYENILAAILAVKEIGLKNEKIISVLKNFPGVEHRLEFVAQKRKVAFYNDTEATNIQCTQIALSSLVKPIRLILGGYERGQDFSSLLPFLKNVVKIYAIGACRNRIQSFAQANHIPIFVSETLKESMVEIQKEMKADEVVLLSPASASWDQYKQCEDRGDEFKKIVNEIVEN